MQNRKAFHSSLNSNTIQALQTIAKLQGINQGRAIDYIVQLYTDQILSDNPDTLQAVKTDFENSQENIKKSRRANMLSIRINGTQGMEKRDKDNDSLTDIF
jgi:hypothetical protein